MSKGLFACWIEFGFYGVSIPVSEGNFRNGRYKRFIALMRGSFADLRCFSDFDVKHVDPRSRIFRPIFRSVTLRGKVTKQALLDPKEPWNLIN